MAEEPTAEIAGTIVTLDFVRHRNAMIVRADCGPLFTDYYLHLADQKLRYTPEQDTIFKNALASFVMHCANRPMQEHVAWTLNFQAPRLNVFLAGDNEDCTVVGRIFTENVKEAAENVFFSETIARRGAEKRRSVVHFQGADVFTAVQAFNATSEQRPVRVFDLGEDHFAMLVSHPDCDVAWFNAVDLAGVKALEKTETLARIDRRLYRWACGCTDQKLLGAIAPAFRSDPAGIFGEGETIHVQCPRCAATHTLTREAMEAYLAQSKKGAV